METVFESENIIFIRVNNNLINNYLAMLNDKEVFKNIGLKGRKITYQDELTWVKNKLNQNAICYSMIEKNTNEFIGNIEIMNIKDNKGELGIAITPKNQNKNYGTESIKAIIKYAYEKLGLEELELTVFKTNKKAIHCYEKVGFIKYKETEEDIYMKTKRLNKS